MREQQLNREREQTIRNIQDKKKEEAELQDAEINRPTKASGLAPPPAPAAAPAAGSKRRNRWDQATDACVPALGLFALPCFVVSPHAATHYQ